MIKLILSDLDETLLNDDGTVHQNNVTAIQHFVAEGGYFVPNTGRSYKSILPLLKTLGLDKNNPQYVISYNGGAIVALHPDETVDILDQQTLPWQLAKKVFDLGQIQSDIDTHIYTLDQLFIHNISASDKAYMLERQVPYTEIHGTDLVFLQKEQPIAKVIFEHPEEAVREAITHKVMAELSDEVVVTFSSGRYVEFNLKGTDKGQSGLSLAHILNVHRDEVAALGDNLNDLAMITAAGTGVAVGNARPEIKEAANIVLQKTNNEAAVADFIERFIG